MPVLDIQAWADNVELVRLPAITTSLASLQSQTSVLTGDLGTINQDFTDRLDAYQFTLDATQGDVDAAQAVAADANSRIYTVDLSSKLYTDNKIQTLRDEFNANLGSSTGTLDANLRDFITSEVAGTLPALTAELSAKVAEAQTLLDQFGFDFAEFESVSVQILDNDLPAQALAIDNIQAQITDAKDDFDVAFQDFPYPRVIDGLNITRAQQAGDIIPLGVSVLREPVVLWTYESSSVLFSPKLPPLPAWFVTDDAILTDCIELPAGTNMTIGQAYPVDFTPDRIYRVTARLRVVDDGTFPGVNLSMGISTWIGNSVAGELNMEKALNATPVLEADAEGIFQAYFSGSQTNLEAGGLTWGSTATDDAVLLTGSASATKAFFHIRQNSVDTNGQVRIAILKVDDVTDAVLAGGQLIDTRIAAEEAATLANDARLLTVDLIADAATHVDEARAARDQAQTIFDNIDPTVDAAITAWALDANSEFGQLEANLSTNYQLATTTTAAIAQAKTELQAEIDNIVGVNDGSGDTTLQSLSADLDANYYTIVEANSAISTALTTLESTLETYADNAATTAAQAAESAAVSTVNATLVQDYMTSVSTDLAISAAKLDLTSVIGQVGSHPTGRRNLLTDTDDASVWNRTVPVAPIAMGSNRLGINPWWDHELAGNGLNAGRIYNYTSVVANKIYIGSLHIDWPRNQVTTSTSFHLYFGRSGSQRATLHIDAQTGAIIGSGASPSVDGGPIILDSGREDLAEGVYRYWIKVQAQNSENYAIGIWEINTTAGDILRIGGSQVEQSEVLTPYQPIDDGLEFPISESQLTTDYYTVSETDVAITNATTSLSSTLEGLIDQAEADAISTVNATLTTQYSTTSQMDSAISNAITTLDGSLKIYTDNAVSAVNATLSTDYLTSAQTDAAISSAITSLDSSLKTYADNAANTVLGTVNSTLSLDYLTSTQTDVAISNAVTSMASTLETYADNAANGVQSSINATLTSDYLTEAQTNSALTSVEDTLRSEVRIGDVQQVADPHFNLGETKLRNGSGSGSYVFRESTDLPDYPGTELFVTGPVNPIFDDFVPVDRSRTIRVTVRVKFDPSAVTGKFYAGVRWLDADGNNLVSNPSWDPGNYVNPNSYIAMTGFVPGDVPADTWVTRSGEFDLANARQDAVYMSRLMLVNYQGLATDETTISYLSIEDVTDKKVLESQILTESQTRADDDSALAFDLSSLTTRMNGAEAGISSVQNAVVAGDAALADDITALTARVGDAEADITSEQSVRASADLALSNSITSIQATLGTVQASVTTNAGVLTTLENHAAASYALRVVAGTGSAELELVAADDPINGSTSLARLQADNIILDGTVKTNHLDADVLRANHIVAGTMSISRVRVDNLLSLNVANAGFTIGKLGAYDEKTDGIFMGGTTEPDGSTGFGLAATKTPFGEPRQAISLTERSGLKLTNGNYFKSLASPNGTTTTYTTNQTINLSGTTNSFDIAFIGGGSGGGARYGNLDQEAYGTSPGGNTTVELLDGTTVIETWVAAGGAGAPDGTTRLEVQYSPSGEDTPFGLGGEGGSKMGFGDGLIDAQNGVGAGSGGGAGGYTYGTWRHPFGGKAGQFINISDIRLESYGLANPKLRITIGAGSAGRSTADVKTGDGGDGADGLVEVTENDIVELRGDILLQEPTATGSFTSGTANAFPDLGAGLWVISASSWGTSNLAIGRIELNDQGQTLKVMYGDHATFVSSKTPVVTEINSSRDIDYLFYKMGPT